jgi:hypothetical protein
MAWDTTLVMRLRLVLGDTASELVDRTFTDTQLSQFIAIAAIYVANEIDIGVTLTINTDIPTISPDPVTGITNTGISNLFVLKAACLIARSELRRDSPTYGIKIRDHLTQYDATEAMRARIASVGSFCDEYENAKVEWKLGNKAAGRAIIDTYASFDNPLYSKTWSLDWGNDAIERDLR